MLKVLYDHQCFSYQEYGGVSRYFIELIKHIKLSGNAQSELALKYSNNQYLEELKEINSKSFLKGKKFTGKTTLLNFLNKRSSKKQIRKGNFDIFHPTYYDPYFLKEISSKPFVITVYDMTHEIFPDSVNKFDKTAENKKILVDKSKKIIAISENTKKDLIRILNVPSEKVEVIYLASSLKKATGLDKTYLNLPDRYILYVGSRKYYKNFKNALLAFEELVKNDDNLFLVCSGGGKFGREELGLFKSKNLMSKILYRPADDISLSILYSNALTFLFPSFYEGFGIPVLEAMNCDCPLALSNVSSLPEIGADAANYFDPYDYMDIYNTLSSIIYNNSNREKLIEAGRKRRINFSWIKTTNETIKLYEKII
ncbi:glycosyltransferase family 1 protein [Ignavibacterium album]|uniref:glycosyltransferase family 4 protein n=1 Tax=Ignavibacterium album TaxID=591197 RepID=UPI0026EFDC92|nr:glycosyltransferase family 1 protein [Ignavibacterium album]